ncbi:unnamed protein product [Cladocopium goreaui]|uniref:Uncharacterized protein n=1 Tax=Cladocopium goreaui TaxID=2562237 RepID=A0A9P1G7Q4_9DINO|nr:unnamed protein product [Cladocopium goreaui]
MWMRHWGAESPKPTNLWSNSLWVQQLSLGTLTKEQKKGSVPLAEQYIDKKGKKRCHGVKRRLKKSQVYTKPFARRVASLFPRFRSGAAPLRNPQDWTTKSFHKKHYIFPIIFIHITARFLLDANDKTLIACKHYTIYNIYHIYYSNFSNFMLVFHPKPPKKAATKVPFWVSCGF